MSNNFVASNFRQIDFENGAFSFPCSAIRSSDLKDKLRALVEKFIMVIEDRKQIPINMINIWRDNAFVSQIELLKFSNGLERLNRVFRTRKAKIMETVRYEIQSENFEKNTTEVIERYMKSVLNSVTKIVRTSKRNALNKWGNVAKFVGFSEKEKKVKKMMKALTSGLGIIAKKPIVLPFLVKRREDALMRTLILSCKNQHYLLFLGFHTWMMANRSPLRERKKLKEFSLYSLNSLMKSKMNSLVSHWKLSALKRNKEALQKDFNRLREDCQSNAMEYNKIKASNLINALKCAGVYSNVGCALRKIVDETPRKYLKKCIRKLCKTGNKVVAGPLNRWKDMIAESKEREIRNKERGLVLARRLSGLGNRSNKTVLQVIAVDKERGRLHKQKGLELARAFNSLGNRLNRSVFQEIIANKEIKRRNKEKGLQLAKVLNNLRSRSNKAVLQEILITNKKGGTKEKGLELTRKLNKLGNRLNRTVLKEIFAEKEIGIRNKEKGFELARILNSLGNKSNKAVLQAIVATQDKGGSHKEKGLELGRALNNLGNRLNKSVLQAIIASKGMDIKNIERGLLLARKLNNFGNKTNKKVLQAIFATQEKDARHKEKGLELGRKLNSLGNRLNKAVLQAIIITKETDINNKERGLELARKLNSLGNRSNKTVLQEIITHNKRGGNKEKGLELTRTLYRLGNRLNKSVFQGIIEIKRRNKEKGLKLAKALNNLRSRLNKTVLQEIVIISKTGGTKEKGLELTGKLNKLGNRLNKAVLQGILAEKEMDIKNIKKGLQLDRTLTSLANKTNKTVLQAIITATKKDASHKEQGLELDSKFNSLRNRLNKTVLQAIATTKEMDIKNKERGLELARKLNSLANKSNKAALKGILANQESDMKNKIKGHELISKLSGILKTPGKHVLRQILRPSNQTKSSLLVLEKAFTKQQRRHFNNFTKNLSENKEKAVLNQIKGLKLLQALRPAQHRSLRLGMEQTLTAGKKIKSSLATLCLLFKKALKHAFYIWRFQASDRKTKGLAKNFKCEKFCSHMKNLLKRPSRSAFSRLMGDGSVLKFSLRNLIDGFNSRMRKNIKSWSSHSALRRLQESTQKAKGQKLQMLFNPLLSRHLNTNFSKVSNPDRRLKLIMRKLRHPLDAFMRYFFDKWRRNKTISTLKAKVLNWELMHSLHKLPIRTLRNCFSSIIITKDQLADTMKSVSLNFLGRIRLTFMKWQAFSYSDGKRQEIQILKLSKIRGCFETIVKRTIRKASNRIIHAAKKAQDAMEGLVHGLAGIPKKAVRRWNRIVVEIKTKELVNNALGSQVINIIQRIPRRTFRDMMRKISSIIEISAKLRLCLQTIEHIRRRKPKESFDRWKRFCDDTKNQSIIKDYNLQFFKVALERIVKRTIRDSMDRMKTRRKNISQAIKTIKAYMQRSPQQAFDNWKNYARIMKDQEVIVGLKHKVLKNFFQSLCRRRLKDAFYRVVGEGDKVKGTMQGMVSSLNNIPKKALRKWNRTVQLIITHEMRVNLIATKMKGFLNKLSARTMNDVVERIKGKVFYPNSLHGHLLNLSNIRKKRTKAAFDRWKKLLYDMQNMFLIEQLRQAKLQLALTKISNRVLRDSYMRIHGEGNKIKGAFKIYISAILRRPKNAFDKWKAYIMLIQQKKLIDNVRSLKLKNHLERIAIRKIRDASQRIIGGGDKIKGAIQGFISGFRNIPLKAVSKWQKFVQLVHEKKLIDNVRSEKLKNKLSSILRPCLRNLFKRIIGNESLVALMKSVFAWLEKSVKNKPKIAFNLWKNLTNLLTKKSLRCTIKAQKAEKLLETICKPMLSMTIQRIIGPKKNMKHALSMCCAVGKKRPKGAFNKLKSFMEFSKRKGLLADLGAEKLKSALSKIAVRITGPLLQRITKRSQKSSKIIHNMTECLKAKPRLVLKKWYYYVNAVKAQSYIRDSEYITRKLESTLKRITKRKDKERHKTAQVVSSLWGKLKSSIRAMNYFSKEALRDWFNTWKQKSTIITTQLLIKALINSQKLKNALERIPRRKIRDSTQRILGEGNKVKGAIRTMIAGIQKKNRNTFETWKKYTFEMAKKAMNDKLRVQRLKETLNRINNRVQKTFFNRIMGNEEKTKVAINVVVHSLQVKPKQILKKWKQSVFLIREKALEDNVKSEKLKSYLEKLCKRSCRESYDRIIEVTVNSTIAGVNLKWIKSILQRRPKESFDTWRNFVEGMKRKKFMDYLSAQKLGIFMGRVVRRGLKDCFVRIIGNGISGINKSTQKLLKKLINQERVVKNIIKLSEKSNNFVKRTAVQKWQELLLKNKNILNHYKALVVFSKICSKANKKVFTKICKRINIKQAARRLIRNQMENQKLALLALKERALRVRLVNKLNSSCVFIKFLKIKARIMLEGRFNYWLNMEALRIYRLKKKVVMKWIFMSSINYQNAFWKVKYVWNRTFKYYDPRHSLMYRKLKKIVGDYQKRLKQYAHFKLLMFYKTMPYSLGKFGIIDNEKAISANQRRASESRALAFLHRANSKAGVERAMTPLGFRSNINKDVKVLEERAMTPVGFREYEYEYEYERQDSRDSGEPLTPLAAYENQIVFHREDSNDSVEEAFNTNAGKVYRKIFVREGSGESVENLMTISGKKTNYRFVMS